jgi:hypothetical protein
MHELKVPLLNEELEAENVPADKFFLMTIPIVILLTLTEGIEEKLYLNFLRDFVWEYFSKENLSLLGQVTDDEQAQWLAQFCWATFIMMRAAISHKSVHRSTAKEKYIPLVAAAAAIYPWNYGQHLGTLVGQQFFKISPNQAAYFSSLFTGVFEGATQYVVTKVGHVLVDANERNDLTVKSLFKEFGLSITIGAVPGSIWQVMSMACRNTNSFLASGIVASSVAIVNSLSENAFRFFSKTKIKNPNTSEDEDENYGYTSPQITK